MKRLIRATLWVALFLCPGHAFAQGAVQQSGPVIPGDATKWLANGIIADAGAPATQQYSTVTAGHAAAWITNPLSGVAQIGDAGTAIAPVITSLGVVGAGQPLCVYDAPITAANHEVCWGTVGNIVTLTATANNGSTITGLQFVIGSNTVIVPTTGGELLNGVTGGTGITVSGSAPSPTLSFATVGTGTVMSNISGITAAPTANALSPVLDNGLGATPGDLPYRTTSAWGVLGPGANGACLTYSTSGPALVWGSCSGSPSSGTVTSVATGSGLTGGTITTTGTIAFASIASNDILSNITGGSAAPIANTLTATIDAAIGNTRGSVLERGSSGWTDLAPGTANYVFTGQGSGADPAYVSLSAEIDAAIGSTRGSILERGSSGWQIIAPGTSGYALTSNGSGADPSYQTFSVSSGTIITALGYTPANATTVGNIAGVTSYGGSTTISSASCGYLIKGTGSSTYTWTLPAPSNTNCRISFLTPYSSGGGGPTITLATPTGTILSSNNGSASAFTFASSYGGQATLVADGTNWDVLSYYNTPNPSGGGGGGGAG